MDGVMELLTQERHYVTTIGIKIHMELCVCSIEVFLCVYSISIATSRRFWDSLIWLRRGLETSMIPGSAPEDIAPSNIYDNVEETKYYNIRHRIRS